MKEILDLRAKLAFLHREETEYYGKASVAEAVDLLIECCDFLLQNSVIVPCNEEKRSDH